MIQASSHSPDDRNGVPHRPLVSRIGLRNYKSIGECDVELTALTVLVGRNGSGKSNFLDALRFVSDSLLTSIDHALKSRGGIGEVRRRSTGHPRNFTISLSLNLPEDRAAQYEFEIGGQPRGGFVVLREALEIVEPSGRTSAAFRLREGRLENSSIEPMPSPAADRLYLVHASGLPQFRPTYDCLTSMGFYSLSPEFMRRPQTPEPGKLLRRDGSNLASVIGRLQSEQPRDKERIVQYLAEIVPGTLGVERVGLGQYETVEFRQNVVGASHPWKFDAGAMSDGTLRALGILVAVFQLGGREEPVKLVGIEEPETALHPAAAGALVGALVEASTHTQTLVTTHSPDLLDAAEKSGAAILAVQSSAGTSEIGPLDPAISGAVREHLYTPGELLRMDQLQPDITADRQRVLFESHEGGG